MAGVRVAGLVLAAGEGRRMGMPKALVRDDTGTPWVVRTVRVLRAAAVADVTVVVGAAADDVRGALRAEDVTVVHAAGWTEGMGVSLRAGLRHLADHEPDAVLVCVVDTPGLTPSVVRRVGDLAARDALARATYHGAPGHPVLIGADHVPGVLVTLGGDVGARAYLARHPPLDVECADVASGADVDTAADLPPGHRLG